MPASTQQHWDRVYAERAPDQLSWFEVEPTASLELIEQTGLELDAALIDVGGGASRLAGELVKRGHRDVTVADLSSRALDRARNELGDRAESIEWIEADVREHDFDRRFALWHDRAVFHFMVDPGDRDAYLRTLRRSLEPAGYVLLATFGPDAPPRCSGLPVERYDAPRLTELMPDLELRSDRYVVHDTPAGKQQQFMYALLQANGSTGSPAARHA